MPFSSHLRYLSQLDIIQSQTVLLPSDQAVFIENCFDLKLI